MAISRSEGGAAARELHEALLSEQDLALRRQRAFQLVLRLFTDALHGKKAAQAARYFGWNEWMARSWFG